MSILMPRQVWSPRQSQAVRAVSSTVRGATRTARMRDVCETDSTQFVARSDSFSLATRTGVLRLEKHAKETWQDIIVLLLPGSEALEAIRQQSQPQKWLCSDFRR